MSKYKTIRIFSVLTAKLKSSRESTELTESPGQLSLNLI